MDDTLAHGEMSKYATSLKTSINAADKLIELSAHACPEILNNAALAVSSHMSWGPVHCFSAAMFFCFQIINNPEQAGVRLMRVSVLRAMTILESFRGVRVAERALDILTAYLMSTCNGDVSASVYFARKFLHLLTLPTRFFCSVHRQSRDPLLPDTHSYTGPSGIDDSNLCKCNTVSHS